MGSEKKYLRLGVVLIVCAIALRLMTNGTVAAFVTKPEVLPVLLLLETGRYVQAVKETAPVQPETPTQPDPAVSAAGSVAVFSAADAQLVEVNNLCGYGVDLQAMLAKPLSWDLTQDGPAVLIVHSHGTESYEKTADYTETSAYRTLDDGYNMVSVGARIAQVLEAGGVEVIHDRTPHDHPNYNSSYSNSRKAVKQYLQAYPSIRMVLDIHRDAVARSDGTQKAYNLTVDGKKTAQIMMVVGTDAGGNSHPAWKENMALAVKLHAILEKETPGICRAISFRKQRFNQDLSAGAMLIEVGAAGNTHEQALLGAELVAQGILSLAKGTADTLY